MVAAVGNFLTPILRVARFQHQVGGFVMWNS
jgi:hypothetical protein